MINSQGSIACLMLLLLSINSHTLKAQENLTEGDGFEVMALHYELLDSNQIAGEIKNLVAANPEVAYLGDFRFAYYQPKIHNWVVFQLSFDWPPIQYKLLDLDSNGHLELVVRGENANYGSGGGTGLKTLVIVELGLNPTQVLKLGYACYEESFGRKEHDAERYYHQYGREITISEHKLIVAPLDFGDYENGDFACRLNPIKEGTYVLDNGRFSLKQ